MRNTCVYRPWIRRSLRRRKENYEYAGKVPIKRFRELFLKAAMAATDSGSQDLIEVFRKYRYFMRIRNALPRQKVSVPRFITVFPGPEAASIVAPIR